MINVVLNPKELTELVAAIDMAVDIANDTVTEDLYLDEDPFSGGSFTISTNTLNEIRDQVSLKIDKLLILVRLQARLKSYIQH